MASVLVVGNGGREHALAWKLSQSEHIHKQYFTGQNAGMDQIAESIDIRPTDAANIARFVAEREIDLTVIGPDRAFEAGVVDAVIGIGGRVFGPCREAARLETDKIYAQEQRQAWGVPQAYGKGFETFHDAEEYVATHGAINLVLKANGLAGGKGVLVPKNDDEALSWLHDMLIARKLGVAGSRVLIQERLVGREASVFAICNNNATYDLLPICQDYKRRSAGDRGPNTGGMGSIGPVDIFSESDLQVIKTQIIEPTLLGMDRQGTPFSGVLYVGLMLTPDGPKVIEYNVRFGDPETQVLMPLLASDLFEVLMNSVAEQPSMITVHADLVAASVALVSRQYPLSSIDEHLVHGLDRQYSDALVFHGNTRQVGSNSIVGPGRGLHIVGTGKNVPMALKHAYAPIGKHAIHFDNMDFRDDIGSNL